MWQNQDLNHYFSYMTDNRILRDYYVLLTIYIYNSLFKFANKKNSVNE